jgi:protein SCO1/2
MNRRAMTSPKRLRHIAILAAAALLASCGSHSGQSTSDDPPLAGSAIGGPFTLVDSTGKTVHWSDFGGKYRIVYFGYTYCPDVCPTDVGRIMRGYARFKQAEPQLAAQVVPMFISIDPERDTPAKVGEFVHAFSDDLIGLTGTPKQVKQAADAFKVYYEKGESGDNGSYLVNHSTQTYLMGREGEPIALLPVDVADQGQAVAAELEKWIH